MIAQQNAAKRKAAAAASAEAANAEQPPQNKRRASATLMTNLMAYQHRIVDHMSGDEDDAPSSPEEQTVRAWRMYLEVIACSPHNAHS